MRRAWMHRSGLVDPAPDPVSAAGRVFALHATDPATLVLSTAQRIGQPVTDAFLGLRAALEADRSLVRVMAMRRTVHVVQVDDLPPILTIYRERLGPPSRRNLEKYLVDAGLADASTAAATFDRLAERVLAELTGRRSTVSALTAAIPELRSTFTGAPGKDYEVQLPIGRWLVDALSMGGHLVRAELQGSWKTGTCAWSRLGEWLPELPDWPSPADAHVHVVRRYLEAFGPATLDDAAWWLGLAKGPVKAAMKSLGHEVVEVEVPGWSGPRLALRGTLDALGEAHDPVGTVFLPSLDPAIMGHADREPLLDPAWKAVFWDRSGNPSPSVWADGRVVGAWAQTKAGEVRWKLLADASAAEVADAAQVLSTRLAGERFAPRFPTPLSRELSAGS